MLDNGNVLKNETRKELARRIMKNEAVTQFGGHEITKKAKQANYKTLKSIASASKITHLYDTKMKEIEQKIVAKL